MLSKYYYGDKDISNSRMSLLCLLFISNFKYFIYIYFIWHQTAKYRKLNAIVIILRNEL